MRLNTEMEEAFWARSKPMALRYSAFCASLRRGANSLSLADRNSTPSACWLALANLPMRRKSNCGSCGGATLFTAFRYSSSGRVDRRRASLPSCFKTLSASAQDKTPTVIVSATSSNRDFMVISFLNTYAPRNTQMYIHLLWIKNHPFPAAAVTQEFVD